MCIAIRVYRFSCCKGNAFTGLCAFAQASVYRSHKGSHPPGSVDAMWINTQPQLWWVTSRQAPSTIWVDQATPRAVYAFRNRDTSKYPHQQFLDHGDLVESYRSEYESKTLPKGCIGTKGKGGDYHPTEERVADIAAQIFEGDDCHLRAPYYYCFVRNYCCFVRALFQCALVVCAEGDNGQHFRDFVSGVDQDLDGFEDEVAEHRRSAPPGVLPGDDIQGDDSGTAGATMAAAMAETLDVPEDELVPGDDDAEAERILAEATDFGVDAGRDAGRPSGHDAAAAEPDEHDEAAEQEPEAEPEAAAQTGRIACDSCCACHVASVRPHIWDSSF